MLALIIVSLSVLSVTSDSSTDIAALIRLFQKEDQDSDGILTTAQFINGLESVFINLVYYIQGIAKKKEKINDFGREFVGRKHLKGTIHIHLINAWLDSEELQNAYLDWQHTTDEGEDHHSKFHKHNKQRLAKKQEK